MGEENYSLWSRNLSKITIEQSNAALEYFAKSDSPHPPTMGEFYTACQNTGDAPVIFKPRSPGSRMVMMIESAKHATLWPEYGTIGKSNSKRRYLEDWTEEDTSELFGMIEDFDTDNTLEEMCELLDNHQFSHGSINQKLGKPDGSLLCNTYRIGG